MMPPRDKEEQSIRTWSSAFRVPVLGIPDDSMARESGGRGGDGPPPSMTKRLSLWQGLLVTELIAALIALAVTIVPSRTGSESGLSGHFLHEPTFLQELAFNLVFVNVVLVLLGLGVGLWWWKTKPGGA
jgi:hypothetical protein